MANDLDADGPNAAITGKKYRHGMALPRQRRGKAPATSPRPPVLAKGTASEATKTTFIAGHAPGGGRVLAAT